MKKVLIYITLFFYVTAQLKPMVAIAQDIVAHTFYKMQHLATVHYENGQYHLHAELNTIAKEDEKKSQQNTPSSVKADEVVSAHINQRFNFNILNNQSNPLIVFSQKQQVISPFIKKSSPPPRA